MRDEATADCAFDTGREACDENLLMACWATELASIVAPAMMMVCGSRVRERGLTASFGLEVNYDVVSVLKVRG